MTNIITDLIIANVPKHKRTRNGISFNCPMCISMGEARNDTRGRGGLTVKSDGSFMYHCFNCNFATGHEPSGHISKRCMSFMVTLGIPRQSIPLELRLFNPSVESIQKKELKEETVLKEVKLPFGARTISNLIDADEENDNFLNVITYLYERGHHIFDGYQYYWSPSNKLGINKRFIIPFYYENKLVGWVGRYASDEIPENVSKYYGSTPKNYIFNMDMLHSDEYDTIILVEGILDAIAINGMAVLGNDLTDEQLRILKLSGKRIILIPDRNKSGENLVMQAIDNGFDVSIPEWDMNLAGSEDVADAVNKFGLLYTLQTIYQSATTDRNTIITRHKIVSLV